MPNSNDEQRNKLIELIRDALKQDEELRKEYQIGDKFKFIREKLSELLSSLEENLKIIQQEEKKTIIEATSDESIVYVYLFNAQGIDIQNWRKMVNKDVFYEYSVNRPIYADKMHVESFLRSRANRTQHGYLTMAVKKDKILKTVEEIKDSLGNPLIKVKEGSLDAKRIINFIHNGNEYLVSEEGVFTKKSNG